MIEVVGLKNRNPNEFVHTNANMKRMIANKMIRMKKGKTQNGKSKVNRLSFESRKKLHIQWS